MYTTINFKTKKALKEAVASGQQIGIYAPGLGNPTRDGMTTVEGPWYPEPHRWYATVTLKAGIITVVK